MPPRALPDGLVVAGGGSLYVAVLLTGGLRIVGPDGLRIVGPGGLRMVGPDGSNSGRVG